MINTLTKTLMLFAVLAAALLITAIPAKAVCQGHWTNLPALTGVKSGTGDIELSCGKSRVRLRALTPNVIRIRMSQTGIFSPDHSFVVSGATAQKSVNMTMRQSCDAVSAGAPASRRLLVLDTGKIKIHVYRSPLRIVFKDENNNVICADAATHPMAFNGSEFQVWKESPLDEHYFGLGDKTGPLDRRSQCFTNWNLDPPFFQESSDPIYKSIPFLLSMRNGRAYGIYLDNTFRSFFDLGKTLRNTYSFGAEGGELNYYFIYGPDPKTVVRDFTGLTGRMPLPPLFALGYQQSRGSYIPQSKAEQVAAELRKNEIPCDVIYLDGDYKQDARPFTVDRKLFPDFAGMVKSLSASGFKTVISLDPYIARYPGKPFDEGAACGYFVKNPDDSIYFGKVWPGQVAFADFCQEKVRRWWGTLHADFAKAGVRGIWDDMNEPAVFETLERTIPLTAVHNVDGRRAEHREVHNVFGMLNTRAAYEGMRTLSANLRPFVLTRSGFAGSQRYAATWTGDNYSTWNHMRLSVPQILNLGLSGFCFAGDDIGGFSSFETGPSPELLTRWMHLGAFNPLYRNHSNGITREREPWVDGPEHLASRRRMIEERYRLLPYIYSCMEECSRTGIPLMRPMFLEFPSEKELETTADQYMFGPALLVAPKLWELDGAYPVQLPRGIWYDYFTGRMVEPPKSRCLSVNPSTRELPIFARGGCIVARQPLVQHTAQTPAGPLELRVYPDESGAAGELYFDDGQSMNYLKGQSLKMKVQAKCTEKATEILLASQGSFPPWFSEVELTIYGQKNNAHEIFVNGEACQNWTFSDNRLVLRLPFNRTDSKVVLSY
jgi:alpha-glucosidase